MTNVIPRWEWRTFGDRIREGRGGVRGADPTGVQESDGLDTCSPQPVGNVKVRDDLMDIKVLREVDAAGLERWEPVMKAGFPLAAEQAGALSPRRWASWPHRRPAEAGRWTPSWRGRRAGRSVFSVVPVHKRRVRSPGRGCTAEVVGVRGRPPGRPTGRSRSNRRMPRRSPRPPLRRAGRATATSATRGASPRSLTQVPPRGTR